MTTSVSKQSQNCWRQVTAFPLQRAIDSCWNRNMDSIGSTMINVARLSITWRSSMTQSFQIPLVFMASGQKMCMLASSLYLAILLAAAWFSAFPVCFCNKEPAIITIENNYVCGVCCKLSTFQCGIFFTSFQSLIDLACNHIFTSKFIDYCMLYAISYFFCYCSCCFAVNRS